jgi:rhodanese-related sulfurtransferase
MKLITRDELRGKLERGDDFKLVMTLSAPAYRAKHIPTSIQLETPADTLAALDPADEIVVYCSDIYCAASIYAYRFLERAGFKRVRRYAGGIADWEEAGYPLESIPPTRRKQSKPTRTRATRHRPWLVCA